MKKVFLALALTLLVYFAWNTYQAPVSDSMDKISDQSPSPTPVGRKVVGYSGIEGKNALEILKSSHEVVTKTSTYGEYVDSIDGVLGGVEGRYWIVYVDGQMAAVGADKLMTTSNQKIEWKFETEEENGTE